MDKLRILFISYYYGPMNVAGVFRPLNFARVFQEGGHEVLVLTVTETLFGRGREENIVRVFDPAFLYPRYRQRYFPAATRPEIGSLAPARPGPLERFVRNYLLVPETQILWAPLAVRMLKRLLYERRIDCLYSFSAPNISHLVALRGRGRRAVPWIADFSDLWVSNPCRTHALDMRWRRAIESRMERDVVSQADACVFVCEPMRSDFSDRYPSEKHKFQTIRHGVATGPLEEREASTGEAFWILHAGNLSFSQRGRTPLHFVRGLRLFLGRLPPEDRSRIRVEFRGRFTEGEMEILTEPDVRDIVVVRPPVAYEEARQEMSEATVLLLISTRQDDRFLISAKIGDYLGAGRPILGLTQGSPAAEMIRELSAGLCVDPEEPEEIAKGLAVMFEAYKRQELRVRIDSSRLQAYSWDAVAREALRLVEGCVRKQRGSCGA